MAPEQEAQDRVFYDHESEAPRGRRRAAADWGVNEDIFDRMPSRFSRVERRAVQHEIVIRHDGETATATTTAATAAVAERGSDEARRFARGTTAADRAAVARRESGEWSSVAPLREDASTSRRESGEWSSVALVRDDHASPARRESGEWASIGAADRGERAAGAQRRESGEWTVTAGERPGARDQRAAADAARRDPELDPRAAARAVMSWGADLDEAPLVPGESRTIVLSRDDDESALATDDTPRRQTGEFESLPAEPRERKTVVISGHPDRLPVPRTQRRPRTAVERIGHRPDRIAGYAVALGFLLVLIAVLTTGQ